MRFIYIFLALLFSFQLAAQNSVISNDRWQGLLWEISGNQLETPCYLYGTMHVSKKLAFNLSDSVYSAIKSSDVVALESDPNTWMHDFIESDYYNQLQDLYPTNIKGFYRQATSFIFPDMELVANEISSEPNMTNQMLYRSEGGDNANFEETTYLDLFIFQAGNKWNKQIAHLEDFEKTMDLLEKANEPAEDEDNFYSYWELNGYDNSPYEMIEHAYKSGDLDMLDSLNRLVGPSRRYHYFFIEKRNEIMADNMDSIMKQQSLFTAIGAAHLPGDNGVIELLRRKGYTLRPMIYAQSKKGNKIKDKVMNKFIIRPSEMQYSNDGLFNVTMPGKLYCTIKTETVEDYFYPDMVNGAYYSVRRINYFGALRNLSIADIKRKVDSLLYEHIPGKIIKLESIVRNGIDGIDIINRTRTGDYQRYQFYFTDLEILIFKMAGHGNLVKDYSSTFFNSIHFNGSNNYWVNHTPSGGNYSFSFPSGAKHTSFSIKDKDFLREIYNGDDSKGNYYLLSLAELNDYNFIEDDDFELKRYNQQFAEGIEYDVVSTKPVIKNQYAALQATLVHNSDTIYSFVVKKGPLYFLLATDASEPDFLKYVGNFNLLNKKYTQEFTLYSDSVLLFSTITLPQQKTRKKPKNQYTKTHNEYNTHYYHKKLVSDSTYEIVDVYYFKYNDYYSYKNPGAYFDKYILHKGWKKKGGLIRKQWIDTSGINNVIFTAYADSLSADVIYVKKLIKNGVFYSLSYVSDTITGLSPFAKSCMDNFKPSDSIVGCDVFVSKADHFFDYVYSQDSLAVDQAFSSIDLIQFLDNDFLRLTKLLHNFDFEHYNEDFKEYLITTIGKTHNDTLLQMVEDEYYAVEDSATLQLAWLNVLCQQQSKESYQLLSKLLESNTPLTNKSRDIGYLFSDISDSLNLAGTIYPQLMRFTRFEEYRNEVLNLLSVLLDSGIVSSDIYKSNIVELTNDAGYELKRVRASEFKSSYNKYSSYGKSYGNRTDIECYSIILAPYYYKPEVKKFMDKLLHTSNIEIKLTVAYDIMKNNFSGTDSIWHNYVSQDKYRIMALSLLDKLDSLSLISKDSITPLDVARSQAYSTSRSELPDSIQFIRKVWVENALDSGYVYFFKSKIGPKWKMAYSGFQPADTLTYRVEEVESDEGISYYSEAELEKEIKKAIDVFYIQGHERASFKTAELNYYYDY